MLNESKLSLAKSISISDNLSIHADPAEVRRASLWLEGLAKEHAMPTEHCSRLDLCLNEALANIMFHGGETAISELIFLRFDISKDRDSCEAKITVADAGMKFNLLEVTPKARPRSLADAEPGGLGLLMLRQLTDELQYSYRDGRNYLSFAVRWIAAP